MTVTDTPFLGQSETKETNPKDAIGGRKVPFGLIPGRVLGELALAMLEGALNYGAFNWRTSGVRVRVYTDAAERHIKRFLEGEDWDPDVIGGVKVHHITKAIASLTVLRDGLLTGNAFDDRPPPAPEWIRDLNARAAAMIDADAVARRKAPGVPEPKP